MKQQHFRLINLVKKLALFSFFVMGALCSAQDVTFVFNNRIKSDTLGADIIFSGTLKNISQSSEVAFIVRSQNDLPAGWSSSLCVGSNCYASFVDSIATDSDFGSSALQANEERTVTLHVVTAETKGSALITLEAGENNHPERRISLQFTATTSTTSVHSEEALPTRYQLTQNYPNPFNPSTTIRYEIPTKSIVTITVYNLLGQIVRQSGSAVVAAGVYNTRLDLSKNASGIYLYTLKAKSMDGTKEYSNTKRMVLIK